jgi:hypothetical protein
MGERVLTHHAVAQHSDFTERRCTARRVPDHGDLLARVRLRGGREVTVLNISPAGALFEGESRLLPGRHIDVHVTTRHGRVLARARVVRAWVHHLAADAVGYRSGVAFEVPIDIGAHA